MYVKNYQVKWQVVKTKYAILIKKIHCKCIIDKFGLKYIKMNLEIHAIPIPCITLS